MKKKIDTIKTSRIIIGSFIILIGIIFLLANLNIITLDIGLFLSSIFKLWPILLILAGIYLLNKKHIDKTTLAILIIFLLILFLSQIFYI
ncbi:MAG TPA: DUF5668 domain-containing protein [bacterium]|jgi:hypothetical protein|nr:hypothetical protein [Patescibacteria group bacterium]HOC96511.1 DUF5668 domain-containing protein [bacterium]HPO11350.1 DUF5668 domain-containing protein [bacterium]HQL11920.1 DUF5668 domain-containing protein [bacterium]